VKQLDETTGLSLSIDSNNNMQALNFVGPRTAAQSLVEQAIADKGTVSLTFETNQVSGILYAASNGNGAHTIDLADTKALGAAGNKSSFTAGIAALHELAEGLAEVNPSVANGLTAHQFANGVAPGLSKAEGMTPTQTQGSSVLAGTVRHTVQNGSGTKLFTSVRFDPPMPWSKRLTWPSTGPVISVTSKP
jgi:hypothetical protein